MPTIVGANLRALSAGARSDLENSPEKVEEIEFRSLPNITPPFAFSICFILENANMQGENGACIFYLPLHQIPTTNRISPIWPYSGPLERYLHTEANAVSANANKADRRPRTIGTAATKTMKSSFEYRSYCVDTEGSFYIAKPMDGDDLKLRSTYLVSVMRGVDALYDALDIVVADKASTQKLPFWIKEWLDGPSHFIDLDLANGACPPAEPASILPFRNVPLSVVAKVTAAGSAALCVFAALTFDVSSAFETLM